MNKEIEVQTAVKKSNLVILAFLLIKLKLVDIIYSICFVQFNYSILYNTKYKQKLMIKIDEFGSKFRPHTSALPMFF